MFPLEETSDDAFLGGKLYLFQPLRGYRAATDPVLLAACCDAKPGQSVLDLGCGVGAAALCLASRVPGLRINGLELQPPYAALARRNAARAGTDMQISTGSVLEMPKELRHNFDHVITNPPYHPPGGTPAHDAGRDVARREEVSLADWMAAAVRRVAPGGWLTLIIRTDRLTDALLGLAPRMGSVTVLPFSPRPGRDAGRIVLRARKGGRGGLRLLSPFVLHEGVAHPGDRDNHRHAAERVFRYGEGLCHLFT
jgi:tRNA1Val (adenine37-N6)-methyltransferase